MTMYMFHQEVPEDTHDYYDVPFFEDSIRTLVTNTPSYVDVWISDIERIHHRRLNFLVVGLDVEWRPNYSQNYENPVATLQLCVGRRCLIFQILRSPEIPSLLINFLRNPSYTFTGVGIDQDVQKLKRDYNLETSNTADIREMAAEEFGQGELRHAGLKGVTRRVLGKELKKPKAVTMSKWDDPRLNKAQVRYACIDAFLSFEIGRTMLI